MLLAGAAPPSPFVVHRRSFWSLFFWLRGSMSRPSRASRRPARLDEAASEPRLPRASAPSRAGRSRRSSAQPPQGPPGRSGGSTGRRTAPGSSPVPVPDGASNPEPGWLPAALELIQRLSSLEASAAAPPAASGTPEDGVAPLPLGDPSLALSLSPSRREPPSSSPGSTSMPSMGTCEYGKNRTHNPVPASCQCGISWPWPRHGPNTMPCTPTACGCPWHAFPWPIPQAWPSPSPSWPPCGPVGPDYSHLPASSLPHGDASLPLGDHLLQSTRDKIVRGEYIDIFTLLNRESSKPDFDKLDEADKEAIRRKKPPRTWSNWLPAFLIYAGVAVRARPALALPMFQYLDLIYRAYVDFPGDAWKSYDENFRMRAAIRPHMRWDEPNPGLWLQFMTPSRPASGDRFDCGHLVQQLQPPEPTAPPRPSLTPSSPRTFCWEFAALGRCAKKQCRYKHECLVCLGNHGASSCPSVPGRSSPATVAVTRPPALAPTPSLPSGP